MLHQPLPPLEARDISVSLKSLAASLQSGVQIRSDQTLPTEILAKSRVFKLETWFMA